MISKNAVALVLFILSFIGIDVTENDVVELIASITGIISFALMVLNQFDRKDTVMFFFKK